MCQVCKLEGTDWKFKNGESKSLSRVTFYRVYEGEQKSVHLCSLCSIDLFLLGEGRFLEQHPLLALDFSKRAAASDSEGFDFSF